MSRSLGSGRLARAFTLIELLVVIAIIALLISILLPGLGAAREAARTIVCGSMVKSMVDAQSSYMNYSKDYYAGPNTSGAFYQGVFLNQSPADKGTLLLGDTNSSTPTSTHDWISPTLGDSVSLSPNRAKRTQQLFNQWKCASVRLQNDTLFGSAPDVNDFRTAVTDGGFTQISYLSPSPFHYYSSDAPAVRVGIATLKKEFPTPAVTRLNFAPRLDLVGTQLSQKVLVADGTRYLAGTVLDFDIAHKPSIYGSFVEATPIFDRSTAYGRNTSSPSGGEGWKLSVRHGGRVINAGFFDGHVGTLNTQQIYSEPKYWHPSGSLFNGGEATPESVAKYGTNYIID